MENKSVEELEKMLEESQDKLSIFKNVELLKEHNITLQNLAMLAEKYLSDEEKIEIVKSSIFLDSANRKMIELIKDEDLLIDVLKDEKLAKCLDNYNKTNIITRLSIDKKISIIKDADLFSKIKLSNFDIKRIIGGFDEDLKIKTLKDKKLIEGLGLTDFDVSELIGKIDSDKEKENLMDLYELSSFERKEIIKGFSNESKLNIIKNNSKTLDIYDKQNLMKTLDTEYIVNLINNDEKLFEELETEPYSIISQLDTEKQIKIIDGLEDLKVDDNQKRKILATLNEKTKEQINTENMPKEYADALNLKRYEIDKDIKKQGKIKIEFEKEPEVYKGLDDIIYVNPLELSDEERKKLTEYVEIIPDVEISDNLSLGKSTIKEYVEGEKWINSVIEGINPEWSDIQKVAYIDNAIGKQISYSPDHDTEVYNSGDSRALWKIIASGKGVCNGISQIEKYIFDRVGIESEIASSGVHAFLKLKNIEIPTQDGLKKGDTILDPTWNLSDQRYGAMPANFCVSYEEIRKHDVNKKGEDKEAHKNDEQLESATLNIDKEGLRQVYKSVGLTLEDGNFPIKKLIDELEKCNGDGIKDIEKRLKLLEEYYPEFASCMLSTIDTLATVLNKDEIKVDKCIIDRGYKKQDENKEPQLYVYVKNEKEGEVFFTENDKKFIKMSKEEFEKEYDCYGKDIEKNGGKRPWEIEEQIEVEKPELMDPNRKKKIAAVKKIEDNER